MNSRRSVSDQIALVERRLEVRRDRLTRHWDELRGDARESMKWAPLAAVGGALLFGYMNGHRSGIAPTTTVKHKGVLATVFALIATSMRVASSPPVKAFIAGMRSARHSR